MGHCVSGTPLKELRADLTTHLATGLGASAPKLGQLVNPPAVIVQPGEPYLTASGYCTDSVLFAATVVAPPGDIAGVIDALDDMIDEVRGTLRTQSTLGATDGYMYGFREVSGPTTFPSGDELLPAVVVTVAVERDAP